MGFRKASISTLKIDEADEVIKKWVFLCSKDELGLLLEDELPKLPDGYAKNSACAQLYEILKAGSKSNATEMEKAIQKRWYAAIALLWLPDSISTPIENARVSSDTALNLSGKFIDAKQVKAIARILPYTSLRSLDVSGNNIGDEGAEALAANKTLSSLNVSSNFIFARGAKALAANKTLSSLNVSQNCIGPGGAKALAANTNLNSLDVSCNVIGDEGAMALTANKTLSVLNIGNNNDIGDLGEKALAETDPIRRANYGKTVKFQSEVPSLVRLSAFAVIRDPKIKIDTLPVPDELKELLRKRKV